MSKQLLCIGFGYTAQALARELLPSDWRIVGTARREERLHQVADLGVVPLLWPDASCISEADAILISASPNAQGDPILADVTSEIASATDDLGWVGYLSTIGVYGDHGGGWVDEETPLSPSTQRGKHRLMAERAWQDIEGLPLHIFRLGGIYGPGRGPFAKVRAGTARRIIKPGQVFSRCHVDDIASALALSLENPKPGAIYNICDDDPAPPEDVIEHAAELLGLPVPEAEDFETADMTPMARSFYAESKRVRNDRAKSELGWSLKYPSYRDGLMDLLSREE